MTSLKRRHVLRRELAERLQAKDAVGAVAAARHAFFAVPKDTVSSTAGDKRGGLSDLFSWEALSATLYAASQAGQPALGLALVADIRRRAPHLPWHDSSTLAVLLRLYIQVRDDLAARQIVAYLCSANLLQTRTAAAYLSYLCQPPTAPISSANNPRDGSASPCDRGTAQESERQTLIFSLYGECQRRGIKLGMGEYETLGAYCHATQRQPITTLDTLLRDMQGHLPKVSHAFVAEVLQPWAASAGRTVTPFALPQPASGLLPAVEEEVVGEESAQGVTVSPPVAQVPVPCPCCDQPLAGYPFTAHDRQHLLQELSDKVIPSQCRTPRALRGFQTWQRFLSASPHVDVLIDGANLGYYGLSAWYSIAKRELLLARGMQATDITPEDLDFNLNCKKSGGGVDVNVNYDLIAQALYHCTNTLGLTRPLVLLHERHTEPHNTTPAMKARLKEWQARRWLYCTPSGLNDDLCWLYAALSLCPPTDRVYRGDVASGMTGRGVYVLTNDLMRDHHFALLSPCFFRRWRERHTIRFDCVRLSNQTMVRLRPPPPYTVCLQEMGGAWHIPVECAEASAGEGGPLQQWVCMR